MTELTEKDKKDVAELVRRIYDSLLRFDPATLESCDLEDCTYLGSLRTRSRPGRTRCASRVSKTRHHSLKAAWLAEY